MDFRPLIRSRRGMVAAVSAAATILLVVGLVGAMRTLAGPAAAGPLDMNGRPVQLEPGDLPTRPSKSIPQPSRPMRFVVGAVGLNVPLEGLDVQDGEITPPGFTSAYLMQNIGVAPSQAASGTVYVVMHSLRGGGMAPGNFLIDVDAQAPRMPDGTQVRVGDDTYAVTGWKAVRKTDVPTDSTIWTSIPGRLVIITCLQTPSQKPSVDNMVITAQLVDTAR